MLLPLLMLAPVGNAVAAHAGCCCLLLKCLDCRLLRPTVLFFVCDTVRVCCRVLLLYPFKNTFFFQLFL